MKNTIRNCGIFAVLSVLVFAFAACPNDSSSGPNTSPKTITIKNPSAGITFTECAVRVTLRQPLEEGVSTSPDTTTSPGNVIFALKMAGDATKGWGGNGGHYIILTDSANKKYWFTNGAVYSDTNRKRYNISNTTSEIAFDKFSQQQP